MVVTKVFHSYNADAQPETISDPTFESSTSALLYSTVKELKIGKATLECVKICLNEFQHCDKIRLLLKCDHIFHTGCIDLRNLNCPICRSKQTHKGSCFRDFNPYNRVTTTA
ncbi:RING finger protein [Medicago truncatula]|uniref:RING finger protein n=1 Tax=Medicago truncatula TaxID=3880 RepID=G7J366_MEDTR|nr:RING finger protein [Medicago truncatula]